MKREFAPGIPAGRVIKSIPKVSPKADNQEWDVSLSTHPAAVRGIHQDLRLVDPKGKAHSWALSKMPEPGQSTYAAQQATHSKSYALRDKPWSIPPGYGATAPGRLVEPVYVQKAEVVQADNNKVRFLRHHGQETEEFVLRKVREEGGKPLWAINNATKNRQTREGQKLPSSKPMYKEIKPEQVSFSDVGEVMTPKLDGAHVLVDMKGPGAPMRVYSYRPTERKTGVIEHTFKFPDFQKRMTAPSTKNTLIRAELWGSKDGKAIPAEQLGGILNSGVLKARDKQREGNIQLRLTGIDVIRHKGQSYENKDFEQKLKALRTITKGSRGAIEMPHVARTEEEKQRLLRDIESGKVPETKEGVVIHRVDGVAPPTKVKFKPQDDVYVRDVFSKKRGAARGHAGGFAYSVTPDGPVVGRVGTGFDHKTRKDMMDNPEKYVGRVAKVRSQGPYSSGALRAPSFDEWHIDKTPPELMKEGQVVEELGENDVSEFKRKYKDSPPINNYHDRVYGLKHEKDIVGGVIVKNRVGGYAGEIAKKEGYKPEHTLSYFYVDEPYRGKGYGDRILSSALKDKGTVVLGTDNSGRHTNEAAKHLYRKHGFEPMKKERRSTFWIKKKEGAELYHGSPRRLKKLNPGSEHGDPGIPAAVFATPHRTLALAYSGGNWGDRDINQGVIYADPESKIVKEMHLREMRPGALEDVYGGKRGFIHALPSEGFEPTSSGARWEVINKSSVTPSNIEEIPDVYAALENDPLVRMYEYDPNHPSIRKQIQSGLNRMKQMDPDTAKRYRSWRLSGVPKEVQNMFREEEARLSKTSQEDTLKSIKKYKEKALEEITPERAVQIARLANKPTRPGAATGIGLEYAREHLDEQYPGMIDKQINKARREAETGMKRTVGFVRGLGE